MMSVCCTSFCHTPQWCSSNGECNAWQTRRPMSDEAKHQRDVTHRESALAEIEALIGRVRQFNDRLGLDPRAGLDFLKEPT